MFSKKKVEREIRLQGAPGGVPKMSNVFQKMFSKKVEREIRLQGALGGFLEKVEREIRLQGALGGVLLYKLFCSSLKKENGR